MGVIWIVDLSPKEEGEKVLCGLVSWERLERHDLHFYLVYIEHMEGGEGTLLDWKLTMEIYLRTYLSRYGSMCVYNCFVSGRPDVFGKVAAKVTSH